MAQVPLTDYGYANARVRAMTSRLLDEATFANLVEAKDDTEVLNLLDATDYGREIEETLVEGKRPSVIDRAFNINIARNFRKLREFFIGPPQELLAQMLSRWDLYNLKTIMRGKKSLVSAGEISRVLVPAGDLDLVTLEELFRQPDLRATIDAIATFSTTWRIPYGSALRQGLSQFLKEHDLSILERALDEMHYAWVLQHIRADDVNSELVRRIIVMDIDIINILTLLRTRGLELGKERARLFFVAGGTLDLRRYITLAEARERDEIVNAQALYPYRKALVAALAGFEEKGDVAFQDELEKYMIRECLKMDTDPLSIGVIIAYMWRKYLEVTNLRVIVRGKSIGLIPTQIRKELVTL
ncbi:MAG: V-type ATPase subunit [Candidatus Geothermincolia bacterium]